MATSNADIAVEALRAIRALVNSEFDNPFLADQLGKEFDYNANVFVNSMDVTKDVDAIATRALNRIDGVHAYIQQLETTNDKTRKLVIPEVLDDTYSRRVRRQWR